jgi:hypothetical protein
VALACREVREGHPVGPAHASVGVVNLACEAVRRQPFRHSVRIEESSIDLFWRRAQDAMKTDCAGHFILLEKYDLSAVLEV